MLAVDGNHGNASKQIRVVAIAASYGGIDAVSRILQQLPPDFPVPIAIVQHLPADVPSVLDKVIQMRSALPVKWAEDGEILLPGIAYLAVPDQHLAVNADATVSLLSSERVNRFRPSADVLFESVAENFGPAGLGVVLSGYLYDGMAGAKLLKQRGGWVLAQDRQSSRSFDMPSAAIRSGAVDFVLPLDVLPSAISSLVMMPGALDLFRVSVQVRLNRCEIEQHQHRAERRARVLHHA